MADPYREPPAKKERFFFASDGNTFFDLDEIVCAYWDEGELEVWLRGDREAWELCGQDGKEFMHALHVYRAPE